MHAGSWAHGIPEEDAGGERQRLEYLCQLPVFTPRRRHPVREPLLRGSDWKAMSDPLHRRDGRATHFEDTEGNLVVREDNPTKFAVFTGISLVGMALVVASFTWSPWLLLPGSLLALFGVSQSHQYTLYTHWYGLLVALVAFGGPLLHVRNLLGSQGGSFLGR